MKQKQTIDMTQKKLLPLTCDIVFKRVFGKLGNEDILRALLEAILDVEIKNVVVKNPEIPKDLYDSKAGVLDIKAEINDNIIIDIEMQVEDQRNMDSRSTFYMASLVTEAIKIGENYKNIKKAIAINLLDYNFYRRNSYHNIAHMMFEKTKPEEFVNMGYRQEDQMATKDLEMHFLELPKFIRKNPEANTKLEQWLWLIVRKGG